MSRGEKRRNFPKIHFFRFIENLLLFFYPALFCFTREMNIEGESEQAGCSHSPQTWLFWNMISVKMSSIFRLVRNAWGRQKSRQICCSKSESEAHFGQVIAPLSLTQATRTLARMICPSRGLVLARSSNSPNLSWSAGRSRSVFCPVIWVCVFYSRFFSIRTHFFVVVVLTNFYRRRRCYYYYYCRRRWIIDQNFP